MNTPTLRVLIIGCGNIAGGFDELRNDPAVSLTHAGAYSRHPGFRLVACVEPNRERRESFMARWGVEKGEDTLHHPSFTPGDFDVVSICSPTHLHAEHLEAALKLTPGLIFCEKPVTPDAALTRHFVETCAQKGIRLAVNHTRRWDPAIVAFRDELLSGHWGKVRSISGTYNKGILNNGSHLIDLVHDLVGPVSVVATGTGYIDFWPDDPTIPALLDVAGLPFHLCTSHAKDYANFELTITTSKSIVTMENGGMSWRVRHVQESSDFPGYRSLGPSVAHAGGYSQAMAGAVRNIHAALTENASLSSTGETALLAQITCEAIRNQTMVSAAS